MNAADDFRGYDTWKCQSDQDAHPTDGPGTVRYYAEHAQCLARINRLTAVLDEIAALCDGRADADMRGDPPRYVPNIWMQIHQRIREVLPR